MSVTALITGRLIADPDRRTGTGGKAFTLAKIAAATEDGDSLVSVIAFGHIADQLAALTKGDTVALTGRAKVNTWQDRDGATKAGLSVTADALLTAYHLRRKRQAMAGTDDEAGPQ
jgi:single-stranded DNA-binding protein